MDVKAIDDWIVDGRVQRNRMTAGTDLSVHSQAYVNKVARQLNDVRSCNLKPRQRDLTPVSRRPVEPAWGRADISPRPE
jgi:hypothetical protein